LIVGLMTFLVILSKTNYVQLKSPGGFMFLNTIIGKPIFNYKLCVGKPGKSRELKNYVGDWRIHRFVIVVFIMNEINSPDNINVFGSQYCDLTSDF